MRKKTMAGLGLAAAAAAGAVALGGAAFAGGEDAGARPAQQIVDDSRDGGLVWSPEYGSAGRTAGDGTGAGKDCPERGGSPAPGTDGESGSPAPDSGSQAPESDSPAPQAPATTPPETL